VCLQFTAVKRAKKPRRLIKGGNEMAARGFVTGRIAFIIAMEAILMMVSLGAVADGQRARLTVNISVDGSESVIGGGSDSTRGEFHESYALVTYLKSSGDPSDINTKDPQYSQNMMARAAAVQQKVREVQKAQGKSVPQMTPEQLPDEDSEPELRYQMYVGYDNCGATSNVKVDSTTNGILADVGGNVPYSVKQTADYHGDANEVRLICNVNNLVFDTKTATFFGDGAIGAQVKGIRIETLRGKTTRSEGELMTHGEAIDWASQQLRQAPASGERSTVLKLTLNQSHAMHSGKYSGEARVKIRWRFEPAVN